MAMARAIAASILFTDRVFASQWFPHLSSSITADIIANYQKDRPAGTAFKSLAFRPTDPETGEVLDGTGIRDAVLIDGVADFLRRCGAHGHTVYIVSHKTEFNRYDPDQVNLRHAALAWMEAQARGRGPPPPASTARARSRRGRASTAACGRAAR